MKKPSVIVLSLFLLSLSTLPAYAEKTAPKRTTEDEKKVIELRKRIETARTGLNGSRWEVVFKSPDPKKKDVKDAFTFQDGMFKSDHFIGRGFNPTNYTVSMVSEKSESAIWETMLTAKDNVVFVRGEWEKDKMSGNITEQLDGGKKVVERYFTTEGRKSIPAESKKQDMPATTSPSEKAQSDDEGSAALVSKEAAPDVTPFDPGTTEEAKVSVS